MEYWSDGALQQQGTQGRSCQYHHPERMEITQPRVARHELPWEHAPKPALYPERVTSASARGTVEMRPRSHPCPRKTLLFFRLWYSNLMETQYKNKNRDGNGLLKLVEGLERKQDTGDSIDTLARRGLRPDPFRQKYWRQKNETQNLRTAPASIIFLSPIFLSKRLL